jgi:myo-inositol 2-dehydrogenase / D-chiro-inositol 1-dehydrogenase
MSDEIRNNPSAPGSRRDFLKLSTAAVVGGAVAGSLSIARSAHAAGDDVLKIGLIGCGGRGTGAANDALGAVPNVKLVAMGDAFKGRLEGSYNNIKNEKKDKVEVPDDKKFVGLDAYQKVLATDVDVVILATPPGFRPIHFDAAVKAGKHVFMEKPVAVDAPGVRMVLAAAEAAKQKKLAVGVGLQRRHEAQYIETIKRLQDGAIGDMVYARVYWNGGGVWEPHPREPNESEMTYQIRNWYYYDWLSGDHITEQHIHNLDVINWLKGKYPVKALGMGGREVRVDKKYGQIYDHFACEFEYDDGSRMISQCRHIPHCWDSVSEHVHGTKGYSDVGGSYIKVTGGDEWKFPNNKKHSGYPKEHEDLFASIRSGNPINEAEYGAKSSMTSILGRMATYGGREVKWDDAINSQINLAPQEYTFQATPPVLPDGNGAYPIAVPGVTQVV